MKHLCALAILILVLGISTMSFAYPTMGNDCTSCHGNQGTTDSGSTSDSGTDNDSGSGWGANNSGFDWGANSDSGSGSGANNSGFDWGANSDSGSGWGSNQNRRVPGCGFSGTDFNGRTFGNQDTDSGNQNMDFGNQNTDFGNQNMDFGNQNMDFGSQNTDFGNQNTENQFSPPNNSSENSDRGSSRFNLPFDIPFSFSCHKKGQPSDSSSRPTFPTEDADGGGFDFPTDNGSNGGGFNFPTDNGSNGGGFNFPTDNGSDDGGFDFPADNGSNGGGFDFPADNGNVNDQTGDDPMDNSSDDIDSLARVEELINKYFPGIVSIDDVISAADENGIDIYTFDIDEWGAEKGFSDLDNLTNAELTSFLEALAAEFL